MALDLSVLDDTPRGVVVANQIGIVLALRLDEVEEDPDQPRQVFSPHELESLADSIRARGVQTPIIVRPRSAGGGMHRIIHGARRYRASKLAGSETIPAIVQGDARRFDEYSQILENLQREDLKPVEIAQFIRRRQAVGERNGEIARQLGVRPEFVTWHLALFSAAAPVLAAFHEGRITGAQQVYRLNLLHEKAPDRVQVLLASGAEITQRMIAELATEIDGKAQVAGTVASVARASMNGTAAGTANGSAVRARGRRGELPLREGGLCPEAPAAAPDPDRLERPVLQARHAGVDVTVQLFRRPRAPGRAFVATGHGDTQEVELTALSDLVLTETGV